MHSSILDEVVTGLDAHRGIWPRIAAETDVPYSTLQKIAQGQRKNPRVQTVIALRDWLKQNPSNVVSPQQAGSGARTGQMR